MRCFWLVPTLCMTVLALTRQSYRCGVGPHSLSLQSQRPESLIVYQINGSQIILLTNITTQPKGSVPNWVLTPEGSDLSRQQLFKRYHHFLMRSYKKTGQMYMNISFISELEGVGVRFRLRPPNGSNLSTLRTSWVILRTGASPIILLSESVLSAILPGQSIAVCGNISGIPPPLITIVRTQDQRKVNDSLYNYDGKCWTLDSSAVKNGGQFTIVAKNCLSSTNATFSIEVVGPPKISLNQSQPYVIGSKDNVSVCGNISGISAPYIYTVLIETSEQIKISSSLYKYDVNCWTVDNSVVKDGGRFTIEIRSKLFGASANASFLVMVKPAICMNFTMVVGRCLNSKCSPPLLVALPGQNVAIPYAMMGFPVPAIQLMKANHNQSLYDEVRSNLGKINSTHLLLRNVSSADSGIYRVSLRNAVGSDVQNFNLEIARSREVMIVCFTSSNTKGTCSLQLPTENHPLISRGTSSASVAERTSLHISTFLHPTNISFTLISGSPEDERTNSKETGLSVGVRIAIGIGVSMVVIVSIILLYTKFKRKVFTVNPSSHLYENSKTADYAATDIYYEIPEKSDEKAENEYVTERSRAVEASVSYYNTLQLETEKPEAKHTTNSTATDGYYSYARVYPPRCGSSQIRSERMGGNTKEI